MRRVIPIVLALVLVVSVRASAQMPTAQRWENVEWYFVMSWQFAGPDAEAATDIFWDHLMPAWSEASPETTCLRVITGQTGVACFGPMEEGLEGLAWQVSPSDVRLLTLLIEREGEAVAEMFQTLLSSVTGLTMNVALKHTGGM
jgi:hypothetical protein